MLHSLHKTLMLISRRATEARHVPGNTEALHVPGNTEMRNTRGNTEMRNTRGNTELPMPWVVSAITSLSLILILILPAQAVPEISGKVTNRQHKPLSGIRVTVWDEEATWSQSTKTDGNGDFTLQHKSCDSCFVEFEPKGGSHLASALFENIPGDKLRRMIVELRRGFSLRGKITDADGSGLKGVVVKVASIDHKGGAGRIHGGGVKVTERDGTFQMVLTPGEKHLMILNNRYPDLVGHLERKFVVTSDGTLGSLVLPGKSEAAPPGTPGKVNNIAPETINNIAPGKSENSK